MNLGHRCDESHCIYYYGSGRKIDEYTDNTWNSQLICIPCKEGDVDLFVVQIDCSKDRTVHLIKYYLYSRHRYIIFYYIRMCASHSSGVVINGHLIYRDKRWQKRKKKN